MQYALKGLWKAFRWALERAAFILLIVLVYLGVTGIQVWLTSRHSDAHAAQAAIVMGAAQYNGVPSPDLAARLQEVLSVWHRQLVPIVVVTGSKEPGDKYTEAEASKAWLTAHGVPAGDVIEVGGNDSWANLSDAAVALKARGLTKVLVVTDGFHEDRSLAIATEVGLHASPVPATSSPISGWSSIPYFFKETVGVGVGRVVGYSRLHDL